MRVNEYNDQWFNKNKCSVIRTDTKLIVLHSTEGSSAESGASTLASSSGVSAHLCVGEGATYRIVPESRGSCTVQEPNPWTLNIEQAGFASWSRQEWLKRIDTVRRSSFWAAWWCKKYKLPNRYLSTKDLDAGKIRGWTTHAALSASSLSSSTHWDPGPGYPLTGRISLSALVAYYLLSFRLFGRPRPKEV